MHRHVYRYLHGHECVERCEDMYTHGIGIDMQRGMQGVHRHMYDICMCPDMCTDICIHMHIHV